MWSGCVYKDMHQSIAFPGSPLHISNMKPLLTALALFGSLAAASIATADCVGYSGPGGPCSTGPGGGLSTGPGGGLSTGPGGGLSTGPGGGWSNGPGRGYDRWNRPNPNCR